MERQQSRMQELTKVSVAVAMSVIRGRPEGASVGQHVEALAARLRERDQTWRSKAEELQREVLRLQRALCVAMATPITGHDATSESERVPGSDSDTPELLPFVPTRSRLPSEQRRDAQRWARLPHEQVLHSLCAFQRAGDTGDVSEEALCRLLDALAATFRVRSLPVGAGQLTLEACRASSRALDMFSSQSVPAARLTARLQAALTELATMLLHASRRQPTLDLLTGCLVELGRSRMAKSFLVARILSEVSALADGLCGAIRENASVDKIPVDEYHNALRLLSILEELRSDSQPSWWQEVMSEQAESLQRLQQQMLALSQEFPLFAVSVWRLTLLVRST